MKNGLIVGLSRISALSLIFHRIILLCPYLGKLINACIDSLYNKLIALKFIVHFVVVGIIADLFILIWSFRGIQLRVFWFIPRTSSMMSPLLLVITDRFSTIFKQKDSVLSMGLRCNPYLYDQSENAPVDLSDRFRQFIIYNL